MHEAVGSLVAAFWPSILLGLAVFLLVYLLNAGVVSKLISQARSWRGGSEQTEKLATMTEPATRCEVCLQETTMQCSRCKLVKYCSPDCQRKHWNRGHKAECQPKNAEAVGTNGHIGKPVRKAPPQAAVVNGNALAKRMLFPYSEFIDLFNWRELVREPCGLINVGNSCYANAVLQCLTYTWPLAGYLLQKEHSSECDKESSEFCFLCELEAHVNRALRGTDPIMPHRILARVRNVGASLGYGRQEDAHEFMRFAVDSMQATFLDEAGGEKHIDPATQETTLIHHIFGGRLQSQVKCMSCLAESNTYESVLDLTVEITGSASLEGALHTFTSPEWLDGDNKYKCDKCNDYVRGCKRLSIHEGPNSLPIILKRFQGGHFGKLNKAIAYPETLNLSPFMSGKGDKPGPYHLYAVIVHLDMLNSTFFGHYLCFVKDASGRWYEADDSDVKSTTIDKVLGQKAYMLFYARSEPHPAPPLWSPSKSQTSENGSAPSKSAAAPSPSRAPSPISVLTSDAKPLLSNGHATSSASSVNGAHSNGTSSVNGDVLSDSESGDAVASSYAGANGARTLADNNRAVELIHTRGVVEEMLRAADAENAPTSSEPEVVPGQLEPANGNPSLGATYEDDRGRQFADAILLDEPYTSVEESEEPERPKPGRGRGEALPGRSGGNRNQSGMGGQPNGKLDGVSVGSESRSRGGSSVGREERSDASFQPSVTASLGSNATQAVGGVNNSGGVKMCEGVSSSRIANVSGGKRTVERPQDETSSGERTATVAREEHPTAQSKGAAPGIHTSRAEPRGRVKRPLMGSTAAPALLSQPGTSRGMPVQLVSESGESSSESRGSQSKGAGPSMAAKSWEMGKEEGVPLGGKKAGGLGAPRGQSAAEQGAVSHHPDAALAGGENGGVTNARGRKRSTPNGGPGAESLGTDGFGLLSENGGVFTPESQLEELSRLLNARPLEALDGDVWDSVLGTGLPNPPLPEESFLEDEDLEALEQPEPLFLPAESGSSYGGFTADRAHDEQGVIAGGGADKTENVGPFGLGSSAFTPIFTSQPSNGKEGGRSKHGATNSGLARGFFGPAKAKRKSEKRPTRGSEVGSSVGPLVEESLPIGQGFGEGFGGANLDLGGGFGEISNYLDEPLDELVLTTDTSLDEKKNSNTNLKPKGIADLIENEELLREVGKSADQRLRSVVKGKVENKAKQGRNDVCNCGSGKKWKKCHGKGVVA